jgi:hypothetical protein
MGPKENDHYEKLDKRKMALCVSEIAPNLTPFPVE